MFNLPSSHTRDVQHYMKRVAVGLHLSGLHITDAVMITVLAAPLAAFGHRAQPVLAACGVHLPVFQSSL